MFILTRLLSAVVLAASLGAQTITVDRPPAERLSSRQIVSIERAGGGYVADAFRLGKRGENWTVDSIRVWAVSDRASDCGVDPGKLVLRGALENEPSPFYCECHALVDIGTAGSVRETRETPAGRLTQIEFGNLRWSVPGGMDILFSVREAAGSRGSCGVRLAGAAAEAGHRLRLLDKKAVPEGLSNPQEPPVWIAVQVSASRQ